MSKCYIVGNHMPRLIYLSTYVVSAAVCSKVAILLLLCIRSLILLPLRVVVLCLVFILLYASCCPFNVSNSLAGEERAGCVTLVVLWFLYWLVCSQLL